MAYLFVLAIFVTVWFGSINFTKLVGRESIPAMNFIIMAAAITAVITRLIGLW